MSQEQPPIRSRRELRKARDAQQESASKGTEQLQPALKTDAGAPGAAAPSGPVAPSGPGAAGAAAGQANTQRSSQIRARDRAALRAIKELEEKEGQLSAGGPPTRRQLRLQQLKEQALTAANPIVPLASTSPASTPQRSTDGPRNGVSHKDSGHEDSHSGSSQGSGPSTDAKNTGAGEQARQGGTTTPGVKAGSPGPEGMTVEQALAARSLLAEQAKNQIAKMEHIASLDPEAVDPEILAEQIALAERAAVMNRRAMAKQKLAEQAGTPAVPAAPAAPPKNHVQGRSRDAGKRPGDAGKRPGDAGKKDQAGKPAAGQRPAPSTANNLAMVTPLEFVQVPGIDRPVMKPPATSHVPVTTRPGTKVTPSRTKKRRSPGPQRTAPADAGPGRSQVIARAEAAARAAARPQQVVTDEHQGEDLFEDLPRIPASSAHGLDPLDAATAGLARANRTRVLQFLVLAFGVVALVSGVILIINGMAR
ncbi:hypothetical protein [Pseudarthrobacter polychromogenes]|uniref:Uncharacterized protein n=1 Tax=Pseudarthrobacter polychromogenes TaxID=1676 RepID=A0ABQ1X9K0_9MICC|nr:hypothetical protein [Pseudarthrobacter polychromogenes]GGG84332.1 hypothetical protein GCM10011577_02380 [Pseudarthrobacter polychromogenes]